MLQTAVALFLFTLELYHIFGHSMILFRIRMLPRKDMVRLRVYFLVELLSVFASSLFTGQLQWLAVIHNVQHCYYYFFWDQTARTKRIISWSSLDWCKSDLRNNWELHFYFGIAFDLVIHMCMLYHLGVYLNVLHVTVALVLVLTVVFIVLFGPYYAWANPNNMPAWVAKRINPDAINKLKLQNIKE